MAVVAMAIIITQASITQARGVRATSCRSQLAKLRHIKSRDISLHTKHSRISEKEKRNPIVQLIALIAILIALFVAMKFLPVQQWTRSLNDWVGQMGMAGI